MLQVGRKVYFDKITGNVIQDTGEMMGDVRETTIEEDFKSYVSLTERVGDTVGVLKLEYGQFREDFAQCNGYRVNPETLELEFSYPDPSNPEPVQPVVFQKPLTEQIKDTNEQLAQTNADIQSLMEYLAERGVM